LKRSQTMLIHAETTRIRSETDHKPTIEPPKLDWHKSLGSPITANSVQFRGDGMVRFPIAVVLVAVLAAPSLAQPPVAFNDAGIHAVQFIDQSEGWAVGDDGVIWHSIDGGKTWERQKSGTRASLRGVHFQTPYTGWAVGRLDAPRGGAAGVMLKHPRGGLKIGRA